MSLTHCMLRSVPLKQLGVLLRVRSVSTAETISERLYIHLLSTPVLPTLATSGPQRMEFKTRHTQTGNKIP